MIMLGKRHKMGWIFHAVLTRKMAVVAFWVISLAFSGIVRSEDNYWSTNGPEGGTIMTVGINPQDHETIFIGTVQNGIYKSTNGGDDWTQAAPGAFPRHSVYSVAIHPLGPDTMFAATVQGMYRSNNDGDTWTALPGADGPTAMYRSFVIHPVFPNIMFVASWVHGWKSTDSGQSWSMLMVPGPVPGFITIEKIAIDPIRPNIIYLAGPSDFYGRALWKSTDFGEEWFQCQNNIDSAGFGHALTIDPSNSDILYFGRGRDDANGKCLWKSTNGGEAWFDITPPNSPLNDVLDIVIMPYNHDIVFICTSLGGLLKSTNGGQSWARSDSGAYGKVMLTIVRDAIDGTFFLGTVSKGIYKSTDEGATWQPISHNIFLLDCNGLAISISDLQTILTIDACGIFRSVDGAQSWSYQPLELPAYSAPSEIVFDDFSPGTVYMSFFHYRWLFDTPGFARSTDNGLTWTYSADGLPGTIDYGEIAISFLGGGKRIFLASSQGLYYTDSLALPWAICDGGLPANMGYGSVAVASINPDIIAAADYSKVIYISTDRGETWLQNGNLPRHSSETAVHLRFAPQNDSLLFASNSYYGIYKSIDYGQNWVNINNDLPVDSYISVYGPAINPYNTQNMFVSSAHRGVFQTHDGGQHWISFNNGLDTARCFGPIYFAPGDTTRLYMATLNASVWSIHRTVTGVEEDEQPLPKEITLSAYPNPFNAATTITTGAVGEIAIDIFDITGAKITSLMARGGKVVWDARALSSGVYFARAHGVAGERIIKVILLK